MALEHLERADFWSEAEAVAVAETASERAERLRNDGDIDQWMDGLD